MKPLLSILSGFALYCFLSSWGAYGQTARADVDQGGPPTRIYFPNQYNAHSQNFAFTQDHRGVLYVGNFAGVLEYDGLTWRTIPTQNITKVSALLMAKDQTVYVGGNGEFGRLRPDSTGALGFVSLSQRVRMQFGEIMAILEGRDGIYFVAPNGVFRWNGKTVTEWPVSTPILSAFQANQVIYISQRQGGLRSFRNGSFGPVTQATAVSVPPDYVVAALPLPGSKTLLISRSQGLFRLAGNTIEPFASPASGYLTTHQATGAAVLGDGSVAISTARGGLVVLAPNGTLKQFIEDIGGLRDQLINALFTDREGNLWLALNNGIAQLEIPSPITLFTESAHQTGEVMDIRRVNGVVYIAAINGLFRIDRGVVRPVGGLNTGCFALAEVGGSLFVATSQGVYQLSNGRALRITIDYSLCISGSKTNPANLYIGTQSGLGVLTISPWQVTAYRVVAGLSEAVWGLTEDAQGNLWLETLTAGLYRLTPTTNRLTHYTTQHGLPTLLYNQVANTTQGLLAYNEKGIYRFEPRQNRFVSYDPVNPPSSAVAHWKNNLLEAADGAIWTVEGDKRRITRYEKQANGFRAVKTPFLPLSASPVNVIYPDGQGLVWFGGRDGIVRYDATVRKAYAQPYPALIRRIQTTNHKRLFNGYDSLSNTYDSRIQELPYATNDVSIEFSSASYPVNNVLTFSYKLENYDKAWSDSTATSNKKEYTNLPPGNYRFRVKARNLYDMPSQEAIYAFRVVPPWYQRWWAIGLFAVAAALLLYWGGRWRLNRLVREKQALETLIRERTEEVVFQKGELEKQSEELAVKNDQLEKIDLIVQSINAEIDFTNLFQTILTKFSVIRNMDSASFLVYEKSTNSFKIKALRGNRNLAHVASVELTQEQIENRLLARAVEEYEDIYRSDDVYYEPLNNPIDDLTTPQSLITIVIKNEGRTDGFITLENSSRSHAFDQRDLNLIRNLKEHLIAAFIKTRLLEDLEHTLNDLQHTQDELVRQEKLASVGQLTKGIVDRILNPLHYVSNFSQLSEELINELISLLDKQKEVMPPDTLDEALEGANLLKNNLVKIQDHSNSTTRILKDMQKLLKEKSRDFLETDLNRFIESKATKALQMSLLHYPDFAINLLFDLESRPVLTKLLPYEFDQVMKDMMSNSFYALYEKSKLDKAFHPEVRISLEARNGQVLVRFRDNGKGMPQHEVEKLFNPFYTTKPTSTGTGLGLFMAKDIIELHRGRIEVSSKEGEFTEVLIMLPKD